MSGHVVQSTGSAVRREFLAFISVDDIRGTVPVFRL